MEISLRLKTIASKVKYRTIADIGTDHGYIPIYLAQRGLIEKAAACDINKGPLLRAEKNIRKYNFDDIIETRLGGGLSVIGKNEFETAIMAGMGGMLIIDIIKENPDVVGSFKQFILQPQLDILPVRKFMQSINYKIDDEEYVLDDNKYYTIISCSPGHDEEYSIAEYLFGKRAIDKKDRVLKEYISFEINKTNKIIDDIKKTDEKSASALKRLAELKEYLNICLVTVSKL